MAHWYSSFLSWWHADVVSWRGFADVAEDRASVKSQDQSKFWLALRCQVSFHTALYRPYTSWMIYFSSYRSHSCQQIMQDRTPRYTASWPCSFLWSSLYLWIGIRLVWGCSSFVASDLVGLHLNLLHFTSLTHLRHRIWNFYSRLTSSWVKAQRWTWSAIWSYIGH